MAKNKDVNLLHDIANGLKNQSNKSKVRAYLEGLRDAVDGKNVQSEMKFEEKEPDIVIDIKDPKSHKIANDELAKMRKLLKPKN